MVAASNSTDGLMTCGRKALVPASVGASCMPAGDSLLKQATRRVPLPFAILAKRADFDFLNLKRHAAAHLSAIKSINMHSGLNRIINLC